MSFAVDLFEDVQPVVLFAHDRAQTGLHELVPDRGVVFVAEALGFGDGSRDDGLECGVALLIGVGCERQRGCHYGQHA